MCVIMLSKTTPDKVCPCNCPTGLGDFGEGTSRNKATSLTAIMNFNTDRKHPRDINSNNNSSQNNKSLEIRKEEVMAIRNRFPTKIPIIVNKFVKETNLPTLDKTKFLVPQEITMAQFLTIIRNRMSINQTQSLYLLVNNRSMISLTSTLSEIYGEFQGEDGFLYITYASQEVFGGTGPRPTSSTHCLHSSFDNKQIR
ncbi:PREDICTED: microtubule-associated proteins 1A/1B light chain 3C-like isoform X1 [Nicrophorus vespilloides]|uniref:Microtubule-associated proteins 1A/1B light chain 3C-like isoform X1 n=2 Tax=Nicrophorus vespilloides TaxID=110193 RepID=A0ABM1N377_NICVS|nr:PREDICTED: microtubule-associated proteins 1A/1B light chain 3C-like isoform X1 [Nicrophorus vespilloides]